MEHTATQAHLSKVKAPAPEANVVPQVLQPVHQGLPQVWVGVVQVRGTPEVLTWGQEPQSRTIFLLHS